MHAYVHTHHTHTHTHTHTHHCHSPQDFTIVRPIRRASQQLCGAVPRTQNFLVLEIILSLLPQVYTVECPIGCASQQLGGAVYGGGTTNNPFMDLSSVCRAALAAGVSRNEETSIVAFKIVAPTALYTVYTVYIYLIYTTNYYTTNYHLYLLPQGTLASKYQQVTHIDTNVHNVYYSTAAALLILLLPITTGHACIQAPAAHYS